MSLALAVALLQECWTEEQWDSAKMQALESMGIDSSGYADMGNSWIMNTDPELMPLVMDIAYEILSGEYPCPEVDPVVDSASTPLEQAILSLVNSPALDSPEDFGTFFPNSGANVWAYWVPILGANILAHRAGPDGAYGTGDDNPFDSLRELYDIYGVGTQAMYWFEKHAKENSPVPLTSTILAFVNAPTTTAAVLNGPAGVSSTAAANVVKFRDGGPDLAVGTSDDAYVPYTWIFGDYGAGDYPAWSLDEVPYVGAATIQKIFDYAMTVGAP